MLITAHSLLLSLKVRQALRYCDIKYLLLFVISFSIILNTSVSAFAQIECNKPIVVYFDKEKGVYFEILRVGNTKRQYSLNASPIKGRVFYFIGPDKKPYVFHGPTKSFMFIDEPFSDIEWDTNLNNLPFSFFVRDNNGENVILNLEYLKCGGF